jgi:hypothetical protein
MTLPGQNAERQHPPDDSPHVTAAAHGIIATQEGVESLVLLLWLLFPLLLLLLLHHPPPYLVAILPEQ